MNITRGTAIYSGGGIYLYYAELTNGNWIMGDDDWLIIVNENPLEDDDTFEESGYEGWQREHLVRFITDDDFKEVLSKIVDAIKQGKTIEEYDNFDIDELEQRLSR